MTKFIGLILMGFFASLTSCGTTSKRIKGPDGTTHHLIKCTGIEECYSQATRICAGTYEIINSTFAGAGGTTIRTSKNTSYTRISAQQELLVKCGSQESILRTLRNNASKIQACYQNELNETPDLPAGELRLNWDIDADGKASQIKITDSTIVSEGLETCIIEEFSSWSFPKPQPKERQSYTYKYEFTAR